MAKYSDIKGFTVQTLSSDPVASRAGGGSWATGGSLNTARSYVVGVGISTAALASNGYTGTEVNNNESYNGTAWTEVAEMNTTRAFGAGAGTYTASIYFGGSPPTTGKTESWNGSAWTEVNDLNDARTSQVGGGTSTAAICVAGSMTPAPSQVQTETWNGSSWTEVADLPNTMLSGTGGGSSTSAIACTGQENPPDSGVQNHSFSWNGSAWSQTANVNTARYQAGGTGYQPGSSNTDIMIFGGGTPPVTAKTEFWDGSSWTEIGDMGTARGQQMAANGTSNDAFAAGGIAPGYSSATEEWTAPSTFTKQIEGQLFFNSTTNTFKETITDIPSATWSSGGSTNTAREFAGRAGSQTAGLTFGGAGTPSALAITEQYDGSSWTEVADLNTARGYLLLGNGPYTAALCSGGDVNPPAGSISVSAINESWDGSSWTEVGDLNTARTLTGQFGASNTSSVVAGGYNNTANVDNNESWDGSSWTEIAEQNTARRSLAAMGIATSGILAGGLTSTRTADTELWDGTSWTETTNINTARNNTSGSGTQTSALIYGGNSGSIEDKTELWNGSSWTELNNLSTARSGLSGSPAGTSSSALAYLGQTPSATTATEEWTASLANKTITAS